MTAQTVSDIFTGKEICFSRSWRWLRTDFAGEYEEMIRSGANREDSGNEFLWNTKHKFVLKIRTSAGREIAIKQYRKLRMFPYLFHATPPAQEALNYQRFELLGLPMAQLLGVGDRRSCFRPQSSFLITEFAENCRDGRPFYPDGELAGETLWRDEFCRRNFQLLAKLHDANYYHRGFTPANELWRKRPEPDSEGNLLDIIWIDVASCRKLSNAGMKRMIPDDFVNFLRFFHFTAEQRRTFLEAYCAAVRIRRFRPEELFEEVEKRLAERLAGQKP